VIGFATGKLALARIRAAVATGFLECDVKVAVTVVTTKI
jgi:hypothetical protein